MLVRQPYAEAREVPWLGGRTVQPGEVVSIPDGELASYLEAGWIPADPRTVAAGRQLLADERISVLAGVDEPSPAEPADAAAGESPAAAADNRPKRAPRGRGAK